MAAWPTVFLVMAYLVMVSLATELEFRGIGKQAGGKCVAFLAPAIVDDGEISSAGHELALVNAPLNHFDDIRITGPGRVLLHERLGGFKIGPRARTRRYRLLVDFRPYPACPDNEHVEVGILVIQQLAHFDQGNLPKAIRRVVTERIVRPASGEKNNVAQALPLERSGRV